MTGLCDVGGNLSVLNGDSLVQLGIDQSPHPLSVAGVVSDPRYAGRLLAHNRPLLPLSVTGGAGAGFPAAVMMLPTRSTATRCGSSNKWLYLCVVLGFEWPNNAPISGRLAPPAASVEAKLWRRSWSLKLSTAAAPHKCRQGFLISTM